MLPTLVFLLAGWSPLTSTEAPPIVVASPDEPARAESPKAEAPARRFRPRLKGLNPRPSYRPNDPTRPTVCLIHGINSTSGSFVHLAPLLERQGYGVVLYDYPYNQELSQTIPAFIESLKSFRNEHNDAQPWSILCHSMGALLARSYVEGPNYNSDVASLILIGPPNAGSALAPAQDILQVLEAIRASIDPEGRTLMVLGEQISAAAKDLSPGSRFLSRLARSRPREGVPYYILAGDVGFLSREVRETIEARYRQVQRRAGFLGGLAGLALRNLPDVLDVLTEGTGDGAVAVASTRLEGATEHVVIPVNHVELIRGPLFYPEPGPVACEPFVSRWLAESLPITSLTEVKPDSQTDVESQTKTEAPVEIGGNGS
ncbi:esterase/lipase family protein [Tautonia rosea]|uniref:esterase/lipase family protein n=1 Tax=Tautonia rosea TaxID=2728037 RepID=UPI001472DFE4|nr:alpha/beta fold hydrolase [Tautonia rosea]